MTLRDHLDRPHPRRRSDLCGRVYGRVPAAPAVRLLHHPRPAGGPGRFHHRAGNQPDVRRADLGLSLAQSWLDQGSPSPFTLAELGPGRGTLMADLLRATRGVPGFHAAMQIHLVEASPALRACSGQARWRATRPQWLGMPWTPCPISRCSWRPMNSSMPCPSASSSAQATAGARRRIGLAGRVRLTFGLSPAAHAARAGSQAGRTQATAIWSRLCEAAAPVVQCHCRPNRCPWRRRADHRLRRLAGAGGYPAGPARA